MRVLLPVSVLFHLSGCGDCWSNERPGSCQAESAAEDPGATCEDLREAAQLVLEDGCASCHGRDGTVEGGMNYVLDVPELVARGKLVPGEPGKSEIYVRAAEGSMPPGAPLGDDDVAALKAWIEACPDDAADGSASPDFNDPINNDFLSLPAVLEVVYADLAAAPLDRTNYRYVSLVHLYNANASEAALDTWRAGMFKLLNSLSWMPDVKNPTPVAGLVGPDGEPLELVYRVDLRDYRWQARPEAGDRVDAWEQIVALDPYAFNFAQGKTALSTFDAVRELTRSRMPIVNADWLVRAAAVPPLYHLVLDLPETQVDFLGLFGVEQFEELGRLDVERAGFGPSGVSKYNRLLERHRSLYGYCWVSYDFAGESGEDSLQNRPLVGFDDPRAQETLRASFPDQVGESDLAGLDELAARYDGGEIICSLPNRLQGYYLSNAAGVRLDFGPTTIVVDNNSVEEDATVVNGLSCMNCHYGGIIPKSDELRSLAQGLSNPFDEILLALHPPDADADGSCGPGTMCGVMASDANAFLDALDRTYVPRVLEDPEVDNAVDCCDGEPLVVLGEPTLAVARLFEEDLDAAQITAELWQDGASFDLLTDLDPGLVSQLAGLQGSSGRVPREQFLTVARDALCDALGGPFDPVEGRCEPEPYACGAIDAEGVARGPACLDGQVCVAQQYAANNIDLDDGTVRTRLDTLFVCVESSLCAEADVPANRFDDDCDGEVDEDV